MESVSCYCQEIPVFPLTPALPFMWLWLFLHELIIQDRFFILWLNRIFIPFLLLPHTHLCERAQSAASLHQSLSSHWFSSVLKWCLNTTWVAWCLLSIHLPFPSLFLSLSHHLSPLLPSSQHCAGNLWQWQTPTRKPAILILLCISIMEQLDMKAVLSGPSWLTACCTPSVNRETKEKEVGRWNWFG